jgi:hypothetical protein
MLHILILYSGTLRKRKPDRGIQSKMRNVRASNATNTRN